MGKRASERFREWMAARRYHQPEIGRKLGVKAVTVCGWLTRRRFPNVAHRLAIEKLTRIPAHLWALERHHLMVAAHIREEEASALVAAE